MSTADRRPLTALLDYSIFPLFVLAVLERARPERLEHKPLDLPLWMEAAHFVLNFEFGYSLALGACAGLERLLHRVHPQPSWPSSWPLTLQFLLAVLLYESISYWQHRLLHTFPILWRFHALHHSGARLNFVRAVRFHFVDFATASFTAYLPLVLLGTPEDLITLLAVLISVLGILQHANLRLRTPVLLDRLICTPAVHRHHHSCLIEEGNTNFANSVMIFDLMFGSYGRPHPVGPRATGIDDDPVPRRFWGQCVGPFLGDGSR
jgi:sterol desaturase/sphingolipid hydroxylase (fatty acid hydroxylase superfamily)